MNDFLGLNVLVRSQMTDSLHTPESSFSLWKKLDSRYLTTVSNEKF